MTSCRGSHHGYRLTKEERREHEESCPLMGRYFLAFHRRRDAVFQVVGHDPHPGPGVYLAAVDGPEEICVNEAALGRTLHERFRCRCGFFAGLRCRTCGQVTI